MSLRETNSKKNINLGSNSSGGFFDAGLDLFFLCFSPLENPKLCKPKSSDI